MSLTRLRKFLRLTGFTRPITQPRRETDLRYLRTQESSAKSLQNHGERKAMAASVYQCEPGPQLCL